MDGSEITFIEGNSGDLNFWKNFWKANENSINFFIEDSRHTNKQQIMSIKMALQKIYSGEF